MQRICVYCGSNPGADSVYAELARNLGRLLAQSGLGLVYGGGSVGLMGVVADAVLAEGGEVIGVIPAVLTRKELLHEGCSTLHRVGSMHERKALMEELADGFIALPGGFGTLDELFEIITWAQLGLHRKPIGLLNGAAYYDHLIAFLKHTVAEGFVREPHFQALLVDDEPQRLLQRMAAYQPPASTKWIKRENI
ncbi:MAG: TIGR00730 family Rossman fold protein [Gammaproteobacteria bacterium]